ncbi:MAG: winged helix-turn-helix transcriptional regulator [Caulobacter sp.]|nr:winged helix-turn-helix transcriptional regulator [Caulobacter sp.]
MSASLDATLAALADPHRRATVDLLREGPRRAGELAQAVGLSAPAMSRHLRTLREAGLVEETHPPFDARVRVYALRSGAMAELKAWAQAAEALWSEQLLSLKVEIEGNDG